MEYRYTSIMLEAYLHHDFIQAIKIIWRLVIIIISYAEPNPARIHIIPSAVANRLTVYEELPENMTPRPA